MIYRINGNFDLKVALREKLDNHQGHQDSTSEPQDICDKAHDPPSNTCGPTKLVHKPNFYCCIIKVGE